MIKNIDCFEKTKNSNKVELLCDTCQKEFSRVKKLAVASFEIHNKHLCKSCVTTNYNKTRSSDVKKRAGAGYCIKHKGKKLEDIVGDEKATNMKREMSNRQSGAR